DMDARSIYHKLSEAENVQSSGIGGGVSIPHLQLSDLKAPITILARLKNPLDFQAADQQLIDLVCLLVSPAEEGTRHLQRLARISRTFKDELLCSSLRAAKNAREMQIMVNANTSEERLLAA
ncbi:MAG: PTS sugar transporter subunit IIA, partial [Alphaproteobacteria bacterium]